MSNFANVYLGAAPNDETGDPLRNAFNKINLNFAHLATTPTNYIDNVGTWSLHIPSSFYTWYHNVSGSGWIA